MELDTIIQGDCLEVMKDWPDNCVDLVLTDPPYNIGKDFQNDNLSPELFLEWCCRWVPELNRVSKYGGAVYVCSGWQYVAEVKTIFNQQKELRLKNWIIWFREDGWKGDKGFAQSHEHILYYIKDNVPKETHGLFIAYLNECRLRKNMTLSDVNKHFDWAINGGGCASSYMGHKKDNFLPTPKHYEKLKQFLEMDNRFDSLPFGVKFNKTDTCNDVWLGPKSEKNRDGHPTQKPVELFGRIVKASSNEGDLILDPFCGSGTTCVAAKMLGRHYIGIDISEEYCKIARMRIKAVDTGVPVKEQLKGQMGLFE